MNAPTPKSKTPNELEILIRARYPLVYVISWEETRVVQEARQIAGKLGKAVFEWSVNSGLVPSTEAGLKASPRDLGTQDPLLALDKVVEQNDPGLYVFKDFHPFLRGQNTAVVRRLREVAFSLKSTFKTILLVSPMLEIPAELEKEITLVDFALPRQAHFDALLGRILEEIKDNPKLKIALTADLREKIVHALLGLTLSEAENVLARALVQRRGLDAGSLEIINQEKRQIIRKSGLLEYYETDESMTSVGGLDGLKQWLRKRSVVFTEQARRYGLPAPRGVLLLGVQGCGKSLMAKTISQAWKMPLLRFDVGRVFGSLVGSSEQNMRRAIAVAESVAPAVFWIDEIDKAFRSSRDGGQSDSGTSARVFGTFLTWLSEKTSSIFVVATANQVSSLPPELLRKGRFDEIFFVDLPARDERREIFRIHLEKRKLDPAAFDLDALARQAEGFSGAEIEEAVVNALFDAFDQGGRPTQEHLLQSLTQTVPLSRTMSEDVNRLRQWAEGRARPASLTDAVEQRTGVDHWEP